MKTSSRVLSLSGRMNLMALFVAIAMLSLTALGAWKFYGASIDQRLSTTRGVVQQSLAIMDKFHKLEAAGQMPREEAQSKAKEEIRAIRYDGGEYLWINDMHPRMVMHPIKPELEGKDLSENKDPDGKKLFVAFVDEVKKSGSGHVDYLWPKPGSTEPVAKRSFVAGFAPWGWITGSGVYVDDARSAAIDFATVSLIFALLFATAIFGVVSWIARGLRNRLDQAEMALRALAEGKLNETIEIGRADELGRLLTAVTATRDSLARIVSQVRNASDSIATASAQIASGNQDLSSRTEQTASSLQSTASSLSQLTGTVSQSAESAAMANQLASSAAQVAQRGGQVVSEVVSTMEEINTSSRKIADIISVIDGIAFQTNILALNAAVEAARAGEQGRGFAVVASEVRSLAQRSAEAAREIKDLIGTSVDKVAAGTRLVGDAGSTMDEIVSSVQRVTDMIGEISAAASEQSGGIASVNGAVNQLDQMTQQNAALVEESAAAAESLKDQALRLADVVATFRLGANAPAAAVQRREVQQTSAAHVLVAHKTIAQAARPTAPARPRPAAQPVTDEWESF